MAEWLHGLTLFGQEFCIQSTLKARIFYSVLLKVVIPQCDVASRRVLLMFMGVSDGELVMGAKSHCGLMHG